MTTMVDKKDSLFEFPCIFPIKVMGNHDAGLEDFVRDALKAHLQCPESAEVKVRSSSNGKFVSITATFMAHNLDELNALYEAITANPDVKMAL